MNVLFVCTINISRSKTAEDLYKDDSRFVVKSAGISRNAIVQVDSYAVDWADLIIVMEPMHEGWFRRFYPNSIEKVKSLEIEDIYGRGDEDLIKLIKERFETILKTWNKSIFNSLY